MAGRYRRSSKAIKKQAAWAARNPRRRVASWNPGKVSTWPSREGVSPPWYLPAFQLCIKRKKQKVEMKKKVRPKCVCAT